MWDKQGPSGCHSTGNTAALQTCRGRKATQHGSVLGLGELSWDSYQVTPFQGPVLPSTLSVLCPNSLRLQGQSAHRSTTALPEQMDLKK